MYYFIQRKSNQDIIPAFKKCLKATYFNKQLSRFYKEKMFCYYVAVTNKSVTIYNRNNGMKLRVATELTK